MMRFILFFSFLLKAFTKSEVFVTKVISPGNIVELYKKVNISLPLGASTIVDETGKKIVEKYGKERLNKIAKLNFKNVEKILN